MSNSIAEAISRVQAEIRAAQLRGSHAAAEVTLIAVSKTKPQEMVAEALAAGQLHFGENKVQEMVTKQAAFPQASWHMIGHLQTNKAAKAVDAACLIHSLDRPELALELEKRAAARSRLLPVLVQVNLAKEDSKSGIYEEELPDFLDLLAGLPHLQVQGLMTIGPAVDDAEEARPLFARLRELRDREDGKRSMRLHHLSMGMSGDYQVAIEEGATLVRVGSAIFGARNYNV
ncbi:MAG: YggS family pyridoxal phosphate-dependent enzyme [Firmicutes bacterium]|nr:YggS family pyridoxal phosphate-dependent enzyme [Bacillota bacterium]